MLKLNVNQLKQALSLAREINSLEGAKDHAADVAVRVEDFGLRFVVPPELVRAHIAKRLTSAHEALVALGIELEPGSLEVAAGNGAGLAALQGHAALHASLFKEVVPASSEWIRPYLNPGQ